MENKSHAMAAGAFVLVVSALLVAMALWLMRDKGITQPFELSTRDTVTGLQPQAAVRFKGVSVGRVSEIGFDPDVAGNVLISIAVDSNTPLAPSTFATLSYQGITGLAFIQLDDDGQPQASLAAGSSGVPRLPLRTSQLGELSAQVPELMAQVGEMTQRMNQLLGDKNQQSFNQLLGAAAASATSVNQLTQSLQQTLTQRVDPVLTTLPPLISQTSQAMQDIQDMGQNVSRTAKSLETTAERLNAPNGPLVRLAEGSGALAHAVSAFGTATLPRVNRVSEDASRAARQLSRTVTNINDNPQSLIFGNGAVQPGPGEPGFVAPTGARP